MKKFNQELYTLQKQFKDTLVEKKSNSYIVHANNITTPQHTALRLLGYEIYTNQKGIESYIQIGQVGVYVRTD